MRLHRLLESHAPRAVWLVRLAVAVVFLVGHGYWRFAAPSGKPGLWSMLHEARTDLSMWLACLFLVGVGAGARSVDSHLAPAGPREGRAGSRA